MKPTEGKSPKKPNQTNMTDYDIFGNSVVLLGCLAKPIEEFRKD